MVALNIIFWFIVVLLTATIIFTITSDSFQDIKQFFVRFDPLKNIMITESPATCGTNTYTLAAQVARPAVSKRTELITVFIYGRPLTAATIGRPSKIILETSEQSAIPVSADFATVPTEGEQYIVALISDDETCKSLLEQKPPPTFERFAAACAKFLQSLKTLKIKQGCVAKGGQQLKGQLSVQTLAGAALNTCRVRVHIKNEGDEWVPDNKIRLMLYCDPYRPSVRYAPSAGSLTLKSGEESATTLLWPCNSPTQGERYRVELKASCENDKCDNTGSTLLDTESFECV